jgi:hypothetical protein
MAIKTITLCIAILFTAVRLNAQQQKPQPDDQQSLYAQKAEKYRKMKNVGTSLTIVGTIMTVTGLIILDNLGNNSLYEEEDLQNSLGGAVCFVVGNVGVGAGIPLWIVGANNHRKYSNELQKVSVKINLNHQRQGLTLTYRF